MKSLPAYIPMDRRQAMVEGRDLPDRTSGAALFADISGFTPLTAAMAEEFGAKQGAEELAVQLNAVYGALIAEVHRYRGSVISFSGDAITCWFDGDDGLCATACALDMQQVMAQFAEMRTPSGTLVSLGLKVAVTTGAVRRFLIGDPQIQLVDVLAGATLDRVAEAEGHAEKDQVVVSSEIISQSGDNVETGGWRGDQRFAIATGLAQAALIGAVPWPALPADALTEEQARPWILPPVYERLKTERGEFLAELRPAVALFLKFEGIDYDQDDAAGQKLAMYIRQVQNILYRYGSYLLQLTIGDKGSYLYAAFGALQAHEDDAKRAIDAAFELQSCSKEVDFITNVQIGVSQGQMWTGAYGGPTRCTYGMLGDEVNVSARLMQACQPGQILTSQRVMQAAQDRFSFHQLPGFQVKGKFEPIPVAIPIAPLPQRPPVASVAPLVGRETELERMKNVLSAVAAGEGRVLRIEGDAGVGKSRLVAELVQLATIQGFRTATGNCQSTGRGTPYLPWREVFRTLFGLLGGWPVPQQISQIEMALRWLNPDWSLRLPLLGDLLDLDIPDTPTTAAFDARFRQQSLFALVGDVLARWAEQQPMLILVEDVHWIDEASAALTGALSLRLATTPILLVIVHRLSLTPDRPLLPTLNDLPHHIHLSLTELSPDAVYALVTRRLGGELPASTLAFIQERAQGNPFFVEELADALRETSHLRFEAGRWVLATDVNGAPRLPDTIQGIVLSRIDRTDEASKLTLKVSSVIGRAFEANLTAQIHPTRLAWEVLCAQLQTLEGRDFIRLELPEPQLSYVFKHNVTQEVAYETLLFSQRRRLHQTVGEALERLAPEAVERLAYHYSHSDAREKALTYLGAAADKARREYANETALDYYDRALALEIRPEWLQGKAEVLHLLGRREEEAETLHVLADTPGVPVAEVDSLWARYHEAVSDYEAAKASGERARQAYHKEGNRNGEARCLVLLGLAARKQGDYSQAQAWYEEALALLDETTQPGEIALALNGLGMVYMNLGDYEEARACHERALKLQRTQEDRLGEANSLNYLGLVSRDIGDLAQSRNYHHQSLTLRKVIGDRWGEGGSLFNLGLYNYDLGDYTQAEDYYQQALVVQRAIGDRWGG